MSDAVALIVNPISGTGARPDRARLLLEQAADLLTARGLEPLVFVTERAGHARELAANAVRQGAGTVVAWGGDGTVNEVASALAFSTTRMAIIPNGSGNGLAHELRLPRDPRAALDIALGPHSRTVDVGELDGRYFVNMAGVGLDARIAHRFAEVGKTRRGLRRYAEVTFRELRAFEPDEYTVAWNGAAQRVRPLLIAIANGRQYGNGAVIAPKASLDDGCLDLVVVESRSMLRTLVRLPQLFTGQAHRVPGVTMHQMSTAFTISGSGPILYHTDGEPGRGSSRVEARIHSRALNVMVPFAVGQPTNR